MKKILKIAAWVLGAIIVIVLALPLWIGPVATTLAGHIVPAKTGTPFSLGQFALNPYSGRIAVGGVMLGNPEGCKPTEALTVDSLKIAIDMPSVFSDTIVIRDITLDGAFVSYVQGPDGKWNFSTISENALEPAEDKAEDATQDVPEVKKADVDGKAKAEPAKNATEPKQQDVEEKKSEKKIIIEHLSIRGVKVQWGPITMPLPPIELTDIGKKSDGIMLADAWKEISDAVMKKLGVLGSSLKELGSAAGDATKALGENGAKHLGKALDALKEVPVSDAVDNTADTLKDAGKALKSLFK